VAAANYGDVAADKRPAGEAIVVYRRDPSGALSPVIARAAHGGSGPDRSRQERPHPHCVGWTPDGRFLVVSDLGVDRLLIYRLTIGGLIAHGEVALPPGSGPRHFTFHPNSRFAYVVTEMGSTVVSFAFDAGHAGFRLLDVASTIPAGARANTGAAIALTPDGRHVLASNRGDDSVARLAIDAGGVARFTETTPSGGRTPRDFTFDPGGRLLAVANQNSDNVALFRYERSSGSLTPLASIGVGSPTVVAFYPDPA
jgi:6-phosphogluconolactonase